MEKTKRILTSIGTGCSHVLKASCKVSFGAIIIGLFAMFFADKIDMKQRKTKFNKH